MASYLYMHLSLEQRRVMEPPTKGQEPRGFITMPGCLTATALTEMIDVEEGFGSSETSTPTARSAVMPLAYYYGFPSPKDNAKLYNLLLSQLAQSVNRRLDEDELARTSGIVIDTHGLIDATGYEVIATCIKAFSVCRRSFLVVSVHAWIRNPPCITHIPAVQVIIVLGHERFYSDMVRLHQKPGSASTPGVAVIKLAKSGGVVERDTAFRRQTQNQKIREYFYGTSKLELAP
ncbi:Cleavage polyadenylation factor subunit clp1 [Modicella reniformis]|uniref:Polynucleotide 5'-hydroxyl-kinase GRC3 n=1 Tax=Modicella reniformis TaxID=1440133 RepID=A0A9P6SSH9_9FUNG|nr:Cleavage polyadenylation factor subunit clp1 [Modicella reniformis]